MILSFMSSQNKIWKSAIYLILLLLISGCVQQQFVCADGRVVSNPGYCQEGVKPPEQPAAFPGLGGTYCGDNTCQSNENCFTCSNDCVCQEGYECDSLTEKCKLLPKCGDGSCDPNENCMSCEQDCYCSDNQVCSPSRVNANSRGCYSVSCGDGHCDSEYENQDNCCNDCGCPTGKTCENNQCIELAPTFEVNFVQTALSKSVTYLKSKGQVGDLQITNTGNDTAKNISIHLTSPNNYFGEKVITISNLAMGQQNTQEFSLSFNDSILNISSDDKITTDVEIEFYDSLNIKKSKRTSFDIDVSGRNYITWAYPEMTSSWVTSTQPAIRTFASRATGGTATFASLTEKLLAAYWIFETMRAYGIQYTTDAHSSADYLQFPYETLKNKGGDCDDHAIMYAAMLEAIGIKSVLVLVPGHIFSGFMTNEGNIVPIETTASNFEQALSSGSSQYQNITDKRVMIPSDNWATYPAVILPETGELIMPYITKQTGSCGLSFNFIDGVVAQSNVQFTNSGTAPGAGCAALIVYDQTGTEVDSDLTCWTINPGETETKTYTADIDLSHLFDGYYCSVK